MKTMKCDLCEATFSANTFGEWTEQMKVHYVEAHADIMNSNAGLSDEDKRAEMMKWMTKMQTQFNALLDESAA